jgi:glutaredoxin
MNNIVDTLNNVQVILANNTESVPEPSQNGITIYVFNGCSGCKRILDFLNTNNIKHIVIDCSLYFPIHLNPLVDFIEIYISLYEDYAIKYENQIMFPIIFNNKKFIGYFNDYETYLKNIIN